MKKLAIISTHPIQYNAPFFRMLAQKGFVDIKVFYTWSQTEKGVKYDPGFGKNIEWDIPLLEGYAYQFINNIAKKPGSNHFFGIDNPTLTKEIKNWGADAVLVYGWAFKAHLNALFYFKNKIPVYFRGDSTLLDEKINFKSKLKSIVLKYVYSKIDFAFYVGEENEKYFKKYGVNDNQLIFMPHAIENNRFENNLKNDEIANSLNIKFGIKPGDFVFLFAGKFESKKNPMLLLDAFSNCDTKNTHLIMVGNGFLESDMKKLFAPNLNIHFLEFQNQTLMPSIYAICNVFILPSSGPGETWGLAINEAMASGKAIIASTACGAVTNLVLPNINGIVFEKNNILELVSALQFCINNPDVVKKMSIKSKEIISSYSIKNNCKILELQLANES